MLSLHLARRPFIVLVTLVALAAITGCGRPKYPVSGTVVYDDGSPFTSGGVVSFIGAGVLGLAAVVLANLINGFLSGILG
jgi:hypothetical protein